VAPYSSLGVKKPWRMFPYNHYSVFGSTGPLNSNKKLKTTETEHFPKTGPILRCFRV
jgi:hypothetical protein